MEDLNLDLIRVVSFPGSIFKFHLIYKCGNANGLVGVYSHDDDWYYLYKKDTDKYRVKRRKDLENQKPYVLYKPERSLQRNHSINISFSNIKRVAEGGHRVMERNLNGEIQKFFGDKFTATENMDRFEVMLNHFSKKFDITKDQVKEVYEKTFALYQEDKVQKFPGYLAALCKSMSPRKYTPEQTERYIEFNIGQRKDEHLEEFIRRYEAGERRVFAPSYGITKKADNDLAYEAAKRELEARNNPDNSPVRSCERSLQRA